MTLWVFLGQILGADHSCPNTSAVVAIVRCVVVRMWCGWSVPRVAVRLRRFTCARSVAVLLMSVEVGPVAGRELVVIPKNE